MRLTRKEFLGLVGVVPSAVAAMELDAHASPQDRAPKSKKVEAAAIAGTTTAVKKFISDTKLAAIPADAVQQAKRCLIDGFGVILAGSTVRGSAIVRDYVKSATDKNEATAFGATPITASAALAALANGASGHAMDYD